MSQQARLSLPAVVAIGVTIMAAVIGTGRMLQARHIDRAMQASVAALASSQARAAAQAVEQSLYGAETALRGVAAQVENGSIAPPDAEGTERALMAVVLARPALTEAALTLPTGWQVAAMRETDGGIVVRQTVPQGGAHVASERRYGSGHAPALVYPARSVQNPAEHPSFATPFTQAATLLWTDLAYAELDARMAAHERRVVVSVLGVVRDRAGRASGVVRISSAAAELDRIVAAAQSEAITVFLCDDQGRLLARLGPHDRLEEDGDDLRVVPAVKEGDLLAALASPLREDVDEYHPEREGPLAGTSSDLFVSYRRLAHTQDWLLGTLTRRSLVPGVAPMRAARRQAALVGFIVFGLGMLGAIVLVLVVRRGLHRVLDETARMRQFDLLARPNVHTFADIDRVLGGLEGAKAALRTLGLYAPLELVRDFYLSGQEPRLGGVERDIAILFTDLEGFTTIAEALPAGRLAESLGAYFAAMAAAIVSCGGTIDKYVGDAVMALFGAPGDLDNPSVSACRAVLACERATQALYASAAWHGQGPLVTRYGVHRAPVLVGHFGAPNRMSYTALGDGVNVAARLEQLGKQFGATRLVSERVAREAGAEFQFRAVDRVVVKGKTEPVGVFELLLPPKR
jgi:adenylate cyclase